MSTEEIRVELGELLHQNITDSLPADPTRNEIGAQVDTAIDIVLAAGYRRPRTITTVEDVEALPEGTKLYSPQTTHSWELRDLSTHGGVRVTGTGGGYTHIRDFIKYEAPLEVLHEPEATL